uniref:Protein TonB n=1 Tax=Candidatus Kentrum sp. DK TaxID=2126562 RepID=A0A450TFK0_9GAMM|nr:MAG: protein TonB [Candidatus Kentron sp. DK]
MEKSHPMEATAKLALCFITRQKWSRKRSLHSVNEHFEAIFNAVRERKVSFAYSSMAGSISHMRANRKTLSSLPIGFFVSGFLHLMVVAILVVSLSNPAADTQGEEEAPIGLNLAMFTEPREPESVPQEASEPPPREETPPEAEPAPVEKPKPPPQPKPKPKPKPRPKPKPEPRPIPKKASPEPQKSMPGKEALPARRPVPPTAVPALSAVVAREEQRYLAALRTRIERKKRYPRASRRRGEEGRVIVGFVIRKNGALVDLRVIRSSGISRLDEAALDTLRRISPFAPIPASIGREQWALSVPISYSLRN